MSFPMLHQNIRCVTEEEEEEDEQDDNQKVEKSHVRNGSSENRKKHTSSEGIVGSVNRSSLFIKQVRKVDALYVLT